MEMKVSSFRSRFPLETEFLRTALALPTAASITAPGSPGVTHARCPRQPCLSTPQRCSWAGGSIAPVTQRICAIGLERKQSDVRSCEVVPGVHRRDKEVVPMVIIETEDRVTAPQDCPRSRLLL